MKPMNPFSQPNGILDVLGLLRVGSFGRVDLLISSFEFYKFKHLSLQSF
jgi:hypothetical protein